MKGPAKVVSLSHPDRTGLSRETPAFEVLSTQSGAHRSEYPLRKAARKARTLTGPLRRGASNIEESMCNEARHASAQVKLVLPAMRDLKSIHTKPLQSTGQFGKLGDGLSVGGLGGLRPGSEDQARLAWHVDQP